jgi:hypothetical protein
VLHNNSEIVHDTMKKHSLRSCYYSCYHSCMGEVLVRIDQWLLDKDNITNLDGFKTL